MTRIIGIVSGKGGVGKTTVSSNLAVSLVNKGKRVLLVDFNPTTPHLNFHFGIFNYSFTVNDVLAGKALIENAVVRHFSGVDLVPGSLSPVLDGSRDFRVLNSLIRDLGDYDYVILDGAPGFGREGLAVLQACDEVLIVVNPDQPSVFDVLRLRELLVRFGVRELGLVVNLVRREHGFRPADLENFTGVPVSISIRFDGNIIKSLSNNLPIVLYKPDGRTAKKFGELASWLEGGKSVSKGVRERFFALVEMLTP